ncbi:MAG TPA: hypothetical protein VLS85_05155 [Hanamia sp.]|nr:hypothetical protein [Hanamia sp.]
MKKLFLVAIAGFFFAAGANAQVQRKMPQHQGMKSDSSHPFQKGKMMAQLNLTPDQKTQMKALHENMQQQRNAIQNDTSLTADQKKEKMKELHKSQMEKVNAILTPDQQAKMKAFRQQRMQNRKMHHNKQNKMNQPQKS